MEKNISINDFLSIIYDEKKQLENKIAETGSKVILEPIPYDKCVETDTSNSSLIGDNRLVAAARCPNIECRNVDCRFMLRSHDIQNSTFKIIETYASSGSKLQCLCCDTIFKFNTRKSYFTIKYELHNNCYVPLSHVRDRLGVDITKYC